jgi:predicted nuclease of predicted toxin-antitoxin system
LQGASDERLYEICQTENRCLVSLDLDFANVIRFPPAEVGGIIVIRLPRNPNLSTLEELVSQFLQALDRMQVERKLWIVELGRIRIHQSQAEDE